MADLKDLYQEKVLDHYRKPRNFNEPEQSNRRAVGFNTLCGDKLTVFLLVENGVIREIGFTGAGCAISLASASMMTVILKEKTEQEARAVFDRFHRLFAGPAIAPRDMEVLGELAAFSTLRQYPVRAKCATLAWHALRAALDEKEETVSTE